MNDLLAMKISRSDFGKIVGVSRQTIDSLILKKILKDDETCGEWLQAYCLHMRNVASGRYSDENMSLARERAALTHEQKVRARRENAEATKLIAPVSLLEAILGKIGGRAVRILEAVPADVKRNCPGVSADALKLIQTKIAAACNLIASMNLDTLDEEDSDA